eukprot:CAMPEP_0202897950 /NCGR_PEP_ID=MMETSP1392-20130828/6577_1 /ASSEMBLY_ACC=CAM_ASM_000868 /TAXON_ID=225041 /ORGANISM="Chlamydomonas chlamydogama, Strain SAG 11-48b" /LENGTH=391 /DNA_ID=CAMNT_0049583727 /DNA_START=248 /DNA_END=1424 /DNA_ORIENTATION=-
MEQQGIDHGLMQSAINQYSTKSSNKGIALAFYNGTAYVVEADLGPGLGHHANIIFTYMQVMVELEEVFGSLIPDVEFVIATSDRPMVLKHGPQQPPPPVFRFCTSDGHADIQIPIFHFYTKKYTQRILDMVPEVNKHYPWASKTPVLFGRFSPYWRHIHPRVNVTARRGAHGEKICQEDSESTTACRVRTHLIQWAANHTQHMDIRSAPKLPLTEHARYKYLLHVDGQALSSRMEQLLPMNSLVFKEESGYRTFYYHLLKPMVHYVPVWKDTPDDMLDMLAWAKQHDVEAKKIAQAGQELALKYLNKRARACYWYRLLVEFSKLLRYKPSLAATVAEQQREQQTRQHSGRHRRVDSRQAPPGTLFTVREYLLAEGPAFEGGKWYHPRIEVF